MKISVELNHCHICEINTIRFCVFLNCDTVEWSQDRESENQGPSAARAPD